MDIKIHNDDIKTKILKRSTSSYNVSPVRKVMATQDLPEHEKNLSSNREDSGSIHKDDSLTDSDELDEAVRDINNQVQVIKRELHFSIDKDNGKTIIKVMDLATQKIIREMSGEDVLKFSRKYGDDIDLKLFSEYT